jgi:hypothetical protein
VEGTRIGGGLAPEVAVPPIDSALQALTTAAPWSYGRKKPTHASSGERERTAGGGIRGWGGGGAGWPPGSGADVVACGV